jgi:hypothetical protein
VQARLACWLDGCHPVRTRRSSPPPKAGLDAGRAGCQGRGFAGGHLADRARASRSRHRAGPRPCRGGAWCPDRPADPLAGRGPRSAARCRTRGPRRTDARAACLVRLVGGDRGLVQYPGRARLDRRARLSSRDRVPARDRDQIGRARYAGDAPRDRPQGPARSRHRPRAGMERDERHASPGAPKRPNGAAEGRTPRGDLPNCTPRSNRRDPPLDPSTGRHQGRCPVPVRCSPPERSAPGPGIVEPGHGRSERGTPVRCSPGWATVRNAVTNARLTSICQKWAGGTGAPAGARVSGGRGPDARNERRSPRHSLESKTARRFPAGRLLSWRRGET